MIYLSFLLQFRPWWLCPFLWTVCRLSSVVVEHNTSVVTCIIFAEFYSLTFLPTNPHCILSLALPSFTMMPFGFSFVVRIHSCVSSSPPWDATDTHSLRHYSHVSPITICNTVLNYVIPHRAELLSLYWMTVILLT